MKRTSRRGGRERNIRPLPLPLQGMKVNAEDITHALEGYNDLLGRDESLLASKSYYQSAPRQVVAELV